MKKTIAKIMAAAMVLSTVATSNVAFAATNTDLANLRAKATLTVNGYELIKNGAVNSADGLPFVIDDTAMYNEMTNYTTGEFEYKNTYTKNAELKVYVADKTKGVFADNNSVTPSSATSKGTQVSVVEDIDAYKAILTETANPTSKITVKDSAKDLVFADGVRASYIKTDLTGVNTVVTTIDRTYEKHAYVMSKLAAGGTVAVWSDLYVGGVDTGFDIVRVLSWAGVSSVNDDYWNAIVKLKASNNRYTPIRVHVDAVEGSLSGWNGLYVQVVNGNAAYWYDINGRRVNITGTNNLAITNWNSNRLQIQDVQVDDLALLRSDAAKGKNLMLDEAYLFNVADLVNDNGLYSAQNWVIDWDILGVNTDLGTVSIGKIQDIRSGLFKKCKEKLVHAKNVKWIRNGAFRENKQLKKAILSDDVSMKKINEKSFYKCKKLNTVKVKVNTLKHVGKNAFGDSTDKKSLKFNLKAGSKAKYNKAVKLFKKSGVKKAKFRKI